MAEQRRRRPSYDPAKQMLVDAPLRWDIADIFHTDLFAASSLSTTTPTLSPSSSLEIMSTPSSREPTPLTTPPQHSLGERFPISSPASSVASSSATPAFYGNIAASTSSAVAIANPDVDDLFGFLDSGMHDDDDALLAMSGVGPKHPAPPPTIDPMHAFGGGGGFDDAFGSYMTALEGGTPPGPGGDFAAFASSFGYGMELDGMPIMGMGLIQDSTNNMGINPQLVDSPAPVITMDDDTSAVKAEEQEEEEEGEEEDAAPAKRGARKKPEPQNLNSKRGARKSMTPPAPEPEKLTLTIAPVKVGGRGTALGRKGTVLSGGVTKRSAISASALATPSVVGLLGDKENAAEGKAKRGRKAAPKEKKGDGKERGPQQPALDAQQQSELVPVQAQHTQQPHQQQALVQKTVPRMVQNQPAQHAIPHSSSGLGIVPPPLPNGERNMTSVDLGVWGIGKKFAFAIPMGTFGGGAAFGAQAGGSGSMGASNASGGGQGQAAAGSRGMSEFGDDEFDDLDSFSGPGGAGGSGGGAGAGGLPSDWRPSPEVFSKMTSKEKRQLRNKISARNFRVRRKEYISTLEGDIAERDRLLDAIRTELGSSRNENLALRREVENLKRVLLDGRGVTPHTIGHTEGLDLPPPAALPPKSAAEVLAEAASASSPAASSQSQSPVVKPNTNKDVPAVGRIPHSHQHGWAGMGGVFGNGGVMAVHTAFVPPVYAGQSASGASGGVSGYPSVNTGVGGYPVPAKVGLGVGGIVPLQENMNPLLRGLGAASVGSNGAGGGDSGNGNRDTASAAGGQRRGSRDQTRVGGEMSFEGFADANTFTMKNMDAYRMHLWGKMAAQYHHHQAQQQQQQSQQQQQQAAHHPQQGQHQLTGLASRMQRSWFSPHPSAEGKPSPLGNATNTHHHYHSSSSPSHSSPSHSPAANGHHHHVQHTPLLAALLSGKGSVLGGSGGSGSGYSYSYASFKRHPPSSVGGGADQQGQQHGQQGRQGEGERAKERERERQHQAEQAQAAMLAAVASQTILKKLGSAFWEAFSGSGASIGGSGGVVKHFEAPRASGGEPPSSLSSASGASSTTQSHGQSHNQSHTSPFGPRLANWDAEKVRRVLEGTAVVRIVDVDQLYKLGGEGAAVGSSSSSSSSSNSCHSSASSAASGYISASSSSSAAASGGYLSAPASNVSRGGSLSVPSSPVVKNVAPAFVERGCGASASTGERATGCGSGAEACSLTQCRDQISTLLEEKMKSLRL